MGKRTVTARRLTGVAGAAVLVAAVALTSPVAAAAAKGWERFANCPVSGMFEEQYEICVYAQSLYNQPAQWEGPEPPSQFTAGNVTIRLKRSLVLQGGLKELLGPEEGQELIRPEDGAPELVPVDQTVPGGLRSMVDPALLSGEALAAFRAAVKHENAATVTIEAAPEHAAITVNNLALLTGSGPFLTLPVKVRFNNPFLGEHCYSGSDAAPIEIELTSGTTAPPPPAEPISGQVGHLNEIGRSEGHAILALVEDSIVSNNFAAPGVEGCASDPAWSEEVDAAIDEQSGLPSPAGRNSTRIDGTQYLTAGEWVKQHGF
ncbi:MAG TPA: hypothetical protein VMA83_01515 [Solirubrobacteraceae bacterium]|nr:hypothetical protein [Solirubrobacteraceae bacterium]